MGNGFTTPLIPRRMMLTALAAIAAGSAQGLIVTNDPSFTAERERLVHFAAARRLPAICFFHLFAGAGGLMAYGASLADSYRKSSAWWRPPEPWLLLEDQR
jgi:hypothetical protein